MYKKFTNDPANKIYIADSADVMGDVFLEENVNIWYRCVLRGDVAPIHIGKNTNVQDGTVIHQATGVPTVIGNGVTIGHNAIVHACTIGDNTLIGMGAIVMDRAVIGSNCIIGAGTMITKGIVIPDGSMVYGTPAQIIRPLTDAEIEGNRHSAEKYIKFAREHFDCESEE